MAGLGRGPNVFVKYRIVILTGELRPGVCEPLLCNILQDLVKVNRR